jgi:hypothetical protein
VVAVAVEREGVPGWVATGVNHSGRQAVALGVSSHQEVGHVGLGVRRSLAEVEEAGMAHHMRFGVEGNADCRRCIGAELGERLEMWGHLEEDRTVPGEMLMVQELLGCCTYHPGSRRTPNMDLERSRYCGLRWESRRLA